MLTGAELIALLAIGFFFVRRQLTLPVPLLPVDLLRIPSFPLHLHVRLLVLRPDAGSGFSALLSAERGRPFRSGDRLLLTPGRWRPW
jgi:hypothetical protein